MQGERSNEEKIQLEAKIKDLTDELEQKNNTHTLLTLQLKRLQVNLSPYQNGLRILHITIVQENEGFKCSSNRDQKNVWI